MTAAAPNDMSVPDDLSAAHDLSAAEDLGWARRSCDYPPDAFTAPPNVSGFCAGSALAGTCVQTFFATIAGCFRPAGCCNTSGSNTVLISWASGAWSSSGWMGTSFAQDGQACGGFDIIRNLWVAGGRTLAYDPGPGGDVTCPDGTHITVPANYGGCADLRDLFERLDPQKQHCDYDNGRDGGTCCTPYPPPY